MRRTSLISLALWLLASGGGMAQDARAPEMRGPEPKRIQQDAAVESARLDLRGQVLLAEISPGLTVRGALVRMGQLDRADALVEPAVQLGGARWVDDQTCQIKLHLDAAVMGGRLKSILSESHASSIDELLDRAIAGAWKGLSFEATGTSVPPLRVMALEPATLPRGWDRVPIAERRDCVSAGHRRAVDGIVQQLSSLACDDRTTVGSRLDRDSRARLIQWAMEMPVTRAQYRDDRLVEVQVFVDRDSLRDQLTRMIPTSAVTSEHLGERLAAMPRIVIGTAGVAGQSRTEAAPLDVPAWLNAPLVGRASAQARATRLLTAREAESAARAQLRQAVETLPLGDNQTIGSRARSDRSCAQALDRLIERGRVSKVAYQSDGSADVTVTLDPNEVWDEVTGWRQPTPQ